MIVGPQGPSKVGRCQINRRKARRNNGEPFLFTGGGEQMKDLQGINYTNEEQDKYGHLALVDIPAEVAGHEPWFNRTLTTVNDAVVRLGIFKGEFPWHKHDDQDEFFLVLDGEIYMDTEANGSVLLQRNQGFTVPKGTMHRPRSPEKSVVLMVERIGVVPTGD
jgi:mannose-6-phosphate isomerase-like protein (cupin superfamily)